MSPVFTVYYDIFSGSCCCMQYDRLLASYCRLSVRPFVCDAVHCGKSVWTNEYEVSPPRSTILPLSTIYSDPISRFFTPKISKITYLLHCALLIMWPFCWDHSLSWDGDELHMICHFRQHLRFLFAIVDPAWSIITHKSYCNFFNN